MRGALRCGPAPGTGTAPAPADHRQGRYRAGGQDCSRWRVKHYDSSAGYLRRAVDDSLARLGVERLDGFLLHRPDPLLQVDEVAETLNGLVASGKVGWVGLSNAGILHCRALAQCVPLRCNQLELSLQAQHWVWDGSLHALQAAGLQVLAWSPMGGGRFGDRLCSALDEVAADRGATANQVALAWLRQLPGRPLPILAACAGSGSRRRCWAPTRAGPSRRFYLSEAARGHEVA